MDIKRMKKVYSTLSKEYLIELLISSRLEIEKNMIKNKELKSMNNLYQRIKSAIRFIDFYTNNRKYMIENDKELLRILEEGKLFYINKRRD
jgi:hypothetical protein